MNRRKKDKRTNNALQNTTQKEKKKIEQHEPLKNGDERRCSGRMVVPTPLSGTSHVAISTICKTMSIAYKLSKTITCVALHNNRTLNCIKNILVL
jgi:hypothetical protein